MKLITETIDKVNIIEESTDSGKKNMFIEGIFLQSEVVNKNKRMYREGIMGREVERYIAEKVNTGRAYGELGHPNGPSINLDRVSHIITSLKKEGTNWIGRAKITSEGMGKIARGLIEDGANLGVSSRGMGTLKPTREGFSEVQDDFFLATAADIVADPSAPDAFVNGIMEGVEWVWNNGVIIPQAIENIKEDIEKSARARKLTEKKRIEAFKRFLSSV